MSVASQIERINANIASAYAKAAEKGAVLPEVWNSENLSAAVAAIPAGVAPAGLHTITVEASDPDGGAVSGGGMASAGMTVTVEAEAREPFLFTEWSENGEVVSSDGIYTFQVCQDRHLLAVFKDTRGSRLPEGYVELEYIQAVQGQYIDTGIKPSTQLKTVLDVEFVESTGNAYLIYSYLQKYLTSPVKDTFYFYYMASFFSSSQKISAYMGRYRINMQKNTYIGDLPQGRTMITLNAQGFSASLNDGEEVTITGGTGNYAYTPVFNTEMPSITLLNHTTSDTYESNLKCYGAKLFNGETLVRDYVPCKNPEGIVGLYDLVNETFYANVGTQNIDPFTPGPAI